MNKYIYAECPVDIWPSIRTVFANSYNDAIEKIINKYGNDLEDDKILTEIEDWKHFREYLNDTYTIALSDLELYEEI